MDVLRDGTPIARLDYLEERLNKGDTAVSLFWLGWFKKKIFSEMAGSPLSFPNNV